MFVKHRFTLNERVQDHLQSLVPAFGYNGFGQALYYRTYSRTMKTGSQEHWPDTVIRVTNGTMSIRKDFYIKNHIEWDESYWQNFANKFANSMYKMHWLPPGRGLWAMGSDFVYERGSMALYNCAATVLGDNTSFPEDIAWLMDSLMHGVGVGFQPRRDGLKLKQPKLDRYDFMVPDTREGWVDLIRRVLDAFCMGTQLPYAIYDLVRPAGIRIKGFGGVSSGPEPLAKLVRRLEEECLKFLRGHTDIVEFKTNCCNLVGTCVVAGNVRRSAEIGVMPITDPVFKDLKDLTKYPHREEYYWMSNNSVTLESDDDFDMLGEVARRVVTNGEPGVVNLRNLKIGRVGKKNRGLRDDKASLFNPCGEIPLENKEVCNLGETCPTVCPTIDDWYEACKYCSFYCSTVSLLATHQSETNKVVARNRRIGVGIVDFAGWKHVHGVHKITRWLRNGYQVVRETNRWANSEAGVPEAIRVTTMKPGGTVPKLPGKTSGAGHPTFDYTLRRVRVQQSTPYHATLVAADIPHEKDFYSDNTDVFEFPCLQGPAKPATDVSLWEQANTIRLLQQEWADNAVSNTLYFRPMWVLEDHLKRWELGDKFDREMHDLLNEHLGSLTADNLIQNSRDEFVVPGNFKITLKRVNDVIVEVKTFYFDPKHEENDVEPVLSSTIPVTKSLSLLPHTAKGVYRQMPEEGITQEEYHKRVAAIKVIDWSNFNGSDGEDEKYCTGDTCEIRPHEIRSVH